MAPLSLRRAEARAQARSALGITSQTRPPAALIEAVMMLGDLLRLALTCRPSAADAVRRCRLSLPDCEARFKLAALRLRVVVGGRHAPHARRTPRRVTRAVDPRVPPSPPSLGLWTGRACPGPPTSATDTATGVRTALRAGAGVSDVPDEVERARSAGAAAAGPGRAATTDVPDGVGRARPPCLGAGAGATDVPDSVGRALLGGGGCALKTPGPDALGRP